jgi:hypothetical protein
MLAQQQPAAVAQEEAYIAPCRHHWIIETANGPVSRGVCRICQETREFRNSVGDLEREPLSLPV